MKMKQDYVLLEKLQKKEAKIIIPETADKTGVNKDVEIFIVKDAGDGRHEFGKLIPMNCNKNDRVVIAGFVSMSIDGKVIHIGKDRDIVAVI